MFTTHRTPRLPDTDATGNLYFTWQLRASQEIFEEFLEARGLPLVKLFRESPLLFPIVHAEADFLAPLALGDRVRLELTSLQIGTTSLSYEVRFFQGEKLAGSGKLVHVCVDRVSGEKRGIPDFLRELLH